MPARSNAPVCTSCTVGLLPLLCVLLPTTTTGPLGDLVRPPGLKVGGYMFDVNTFRWLKIASIDEVKTGPAAPFIRFTTDPEDVDPSPRPRASFPAMFPNNVVEAYTLKKN